MPGPKRPGRGTPRRMTARSGRLVLPTPSPDARVDLHLHSTASDGTATPTELVVAAKSLGLAAIALSDHDSIGGVREAMAAGAEHGVEVLPSVEIGIAHDPDRGLVEVDVHGYLVDPENEELTGVLDRLQVAKNRKLDRQIAVLAENGMPIDRNEVLAIANGDTVRRPHIWKVLHEHHPDLAAEEFFDRTSFGGDWHVTKEFSLTLEECVALVERAGGVPVLAHPGAYNATFAKTGELIDPAVDDAIRLCAGAGMKGIEVYYTYDKNRPFYNAEPLITKGELGTLIAHYEEMAESLGLLRTGGTDYHGTSKPQISIGEIDVPYRLVSDLKAAAGR